MSADRQEAGARSFTSGRGRSRGTIASIFRYQNANTESSARDDARTARRIESALEGQSGARVLELGCGTRAGMVVAMHSIGIACSGIDYDAVVPKPSLKGWLETARRNGIDRLAKTVVRQAIFDRRYFRTLSSELGVPLRWDGLDFGSADARDLPFDDGTFSLVHSVAVFEHLADLDATVDEMARVMRAGAEALVCTHLFPSLSGGHHMDFGHGPNPDSPVPPWDHLRENRFPAHVFLNRLRADDYLKAFERHFEIVEVDYELEGEELLADSRLRDELAAWSTEDLTRRTQNVRLRKRG